MLHFHSNINLYSILRNHFYYGRFEYPRNSGNWYTGKHKPIILRELFEKVQAQLSRDNKVRSECKEFAFTKLMKCGLCGSGVTAEEKFKKISDGSVRRYVYYGCTRGRNINCKGGYIREEELTKQLIKMVSQISLDELGMKKKIEKEVERYDKFRYGVLGNKKDNDQKQKDIDHKNYAKYILREGNIYEKRELLDNLRSKLVMKNKIINLE